VSKQAFVFLSRIPELAAKLKRLSFSAIRHEAAIDAVKIIGTWVKIWHFGSTGDYFRVVDRVLV
jgi:hypothetical protein